MAPVATDWPYQPFYCEENVWQLCLLSDADVGLEDRHAVFVSNAAGQVALWDQRAAPHPDASILWDYHVVLWGRDADSAAVIVDHDNATAVRQTAAQWYAATFPWGDALPPEYLPRFRVVPAETFVAEFESDRSHMLDAAGDWRAPPPPWPAPSLGSSNLWDFVDTFEPFVGVTHDLASFWAAFCQ